MNKKQSFALLDVFDHAGGNFIDTANSYQNEESETWVGERMEERGIRDQLVICHKVHGEVPGGMRSERGIKCSNSVGNHRKSMTLSVRDSLKKLRTDYIGKPSKTQQWVIGMLLRS